MALAIQKSRTPSVKGRLLSTLIMAFALMLQPMYGVVAGQVASAVAPAATVANVDASYVKNTGYTGIYVGFDIETAETVESVEVRANRSNGAHSMIAKEPVLSSINANASNPGGYHTGGTLIVTGSRASGSWEQIGTWYGASRPVSVDVIVTLAGGGSVTGTDLTIRDNGATAEEVMPASPDIQMTRFSTYNEEQPSMGIAFQFNFKGFDDASRVDVYMELENGDRVVKSLKSGRVADLVNGKTALSGRVFTKEMPGQTEDTSSSWERVRYVTASGVDYTRNVLWTENTRPRVAYATIYSNNQDPYTSNVINFSETYHGTTPYENVLPNTPAITSVDAYYNQKTGLGKSWKGIGVDFRTQYINAATKLELKINRTDSTTYSAFAKQSVLDAINSEAAKQTTTLRSGVIAIQPGDYEGSWEQSSTPWTGAGAPESVDIIITLVDGTTVELRDSTISSSLATWDEVKPAGDTTPPTFNITNLVDGQLVGTANTNKLVIKGTLTDPSGARALIQLVKPGVGVVADNVTVHAPVEDGTLAEFSTAGLASGAYELHVRPTDYKGNAVPFFVISFAIDNVLPNISISSSHGDVTSKIFREVSFKLHDKGKIDRAELNGKPFTSNRGSEWGDLNNVWANRGWSGAREGENTLVLFDMAGNHVSYSFTIDRTAPTATFVLSNSNGNALTNKDVVVTMTSSEPIQAPDGWSPVGDAQNIFTRSYSSNGKQEVVLTDLAGNTSAPQKFEIKRIDREAPTITGVTDGAVVKGPIELTVFDPKYQGYDGFDRVGGLTVNGVVVPTTEGPGKTYLYTIEEEGSYTVVATDKAGNYTTIKFTIDNTAPVIDGVAVVAASNSITVSGTTDTPSAPVRVTLGGVTRDATINLSTRQWVVTFSNLLPDTAYSYQISSADAAGNVFSTTGSARTVVAFTPGPDTTTGGDNEDDEDEDSENQAAQPFANPFFFGNQDVLGDRDETETDPVADSENEGAVAGDQDDNGTRLTDTAAFGSDSKLLGMAWYWWLAILAALVGGWLAVAAAIRRGREEEA